MTPMLDGKSVTIQDLDQAFEPHRGTPTWRSGGTSFPTLIDLSNWVTQMLNRLGMDGADRAKVSYVSGVDSAGKPYYGALIFWFG